MRILPLTNFSLCIAICLILGIYTFYSPVNLEETPPPSEFKKSKELPPNPFRLEQEKYEAIGSKGLEIKWIEPKLQLPDLHEAFVFYGKSGRPDSQEGKSLLRLTFKGREESRAFAEKTKLFLTYSEGRYDFSPGNQRTALWLEAKRQGDALSVAVFMLDDTQTLIKTPDNLHSFTLNAEEFNTPPRLDMEVGGIRVDGGYFMRQHGRLVGKDVFFEMHGGEEFSHAKERERIDFLLDEDRYTCFVKEGDLLVWREGKWKVVDAAESTVGCPLLFAKKMDDRCLLFEFWDVAGQAKLPLNLVRLKVHDPFPDVAQEFKFVGAKTWTQFIVECRGKRLILKSGDWLVLSGEQWLKITTAQEIDAYVNGTLAGPLFVLDRLEKQEGNQVLIGHMFNTTRTEVVDCQLKSFAKEPIKEKAEPLAES